jgi:hypothetical protein
MISPRVWKLATRGRACSALALLIVLELPSLFGDAPAPKSTKKGTVSLAGLDTPTITAQLRAAAAAGRQKDFDALGLALAADATRARPVLAALAAEHSGEAATLEAELLVWLARGNDVRDGAQAGALPTAELGERAASLFDHEDPFVHGLAEWALSIRLGVDYESAEERTGGHRVAKAWPGADAPGWFQRWESLPADSLVEFDYVRQAAALGWHRQSASLLTSAADYLGRAESVAAYALPRAKAAQNRILREAVDAVRAANHALRDVAEARPTDLTAHRRHWLDLRRAVRAVALANPDLAFQEIVFGLRPAARLGGNITVGRWNMHPPGGDIFVKTGFSPSSPIRPLLQMRLGPGHVRGLELSWDADKLVFAYARQPGRAAAGAANAALRPKSEIGGYFGLGIGAVEEMSHLFEVNVDGTGLRQLTNSEYHADQEPTYLPNGDIVFVSDRSNFGSQCAGALEQDNMILNLYRCDPDGRHIRPLSNNKDFDRHPRVMDNGQLLFLHWEYQERHLWNTHTLWTSRPDGAMADAVFKQHIESGPMSLREARQIPGTEKLVAIACGHHNYDQGAILLCDYGQGINERSAMRTLTPGPSPTEGGYGGVKTVAEGGVPDGGGHYMFPFPLSEKSLLTAYSYRKPENMAGQNYCLYYIDVWGNKELIHRDRRLSVAYLAPLRKTPRPPVIKDLPGKAASAARHAVAIVGDVYSGWPEAKRGSVKYLRIAQKVPWPCVPDDTKACGFNDLHWMPAAWEPVLGMWDWGHARVIGTVPVEADGSAHFKVPADQTVYFQALDENFVEVRRMRSNVSFPAGETRSCIGCHESKALAPPAQRSLTTLALQRPPSMPEPPLWGDRRVPDYERDIQPIFDRHCTSCHGEKEPKGGLDFSARKVDDYMQSYRTLFGLKPTDATPVSNGFWSIWHPQEAPKSDEAYAAGKTFLKNVLRAPSPAQLISVADYTGGAEVTQLEQFGSPRSKLVRTLQQDAEHRREVKMNRADWLALVTWIDLNAQYWGTFIEKDGHFASKRAGAKAGGVVAPRRVQVEFPDPWRQPPSGNWFWQDETTVAVRP